MHQSAPPDGAMSCARGRSRLADFALDPDIYHLNHGSYGAPPRAVLAEQARWRSRMEANPDTFFRVDLPALIREAADAAAVCLGGNGKDWVFVDNATTGVNAVVASQRLAPGDEILTTDHAYGAVQKTLAFHAERCGARLIEVTLPVPIDGNDAVLTCLAEGLSPRTRLVVADHVTSKSALVLPVGRIAKLCQEAGVPLLVDGAHALGMLDLDVPALGADWYTGNAHKWLMAPRGCGLLWCAPEGQHALHPAVISHGLGQGYCAEFDWTGTRDPSAWLTLSAAITCHQAFGGARLKAANHDLAMRAADTAADILGTELVSPSSMAGSMMTVRLPGRLPPTERAASALLRRLSAEHATEAAIVPLADSLWWRISAQIYNELDDFAAAARLLRRLLT